MTTSDTLTSRSTGMIRRTWTILPDDELLFFVINVKGYSVKFKFDNVYSWCLGFRVSDTECDHISALQAHMNDIFNNLSKQNIGIPATRSIDEPDAIVMYPERFLKTFFFFQSLNGRVSSVVKVEGDRQWQTQSKPKHEETRYQTQAHQPKSYELHDYFIKHIVEQNCVI